MLTSVHRILPIREATSESYLEKMVCSGSIDFGLNLVSGKAMEKRGRKDERSWIPMLVMVGFLGLWVMID